MTENNNTINFADFTFTSDVAQFQAARTAVANQLQCDESTMPLMLSKEAVYAVLERYGYDPRSIFMSPEKGGLVKWADSKSLDNGMGIAPAGAGVAWFPQALTAFITRLGKHGECFRGTRKTRKSTGKRWSWSATFDDNNWGEYDSKGATVNVQLIIPAHIATLYSGSLKHDALNLLVENINQQAAAADSIAKFLNNNN